MQELDARLCELINDGLDRHDTWFAYKGYSRSDTSPVLHGSIHETRVRIECTQLEGDASASHEIAVTTFNRHPLGMVSTGEGFATAISAQLWELVLADLAALDQDR